VKISENAAIKTRRMGKLLKPNAASVTRAWAFWQGF
jgi:hypothetical protein